uniref:Uncharacterized protein n=1 Tax=Cacopsylla melanoneura TaxID=428564 RepID=A0A8D8YXY0_9HEMI
MSNVKKTGNREREKVGKREHDGRKVLVKNENYYEIEFNALLNLVLIISAKLFSEKIASHYYFYCERKLSKHFPWCFSSHSPPRVARPIDLPNVHFVIFLFLEISYSELRLRARGRDPATLCGKDL